MATTFDVIVLGVGSMGSAACYYLAKQGASVLGLEQFEMPHERGSHAGQSRLIRKAYYEHPSYVPLLDRAYQNWRDLEAATETPVYVETGLFYAAPSGHSLLAGVQESARLHQIPLQTLSPADVRRDYSAFAIPDHYKTLLERGAGFVTPERAISLYVQQAMQHGATIRTGEKILDWRKDGSGYVVRTVTGTYRCQKLVITAGPWAGTLLPALAPKLIVTRQVLAWIQPQQPARFALGNFPCWVVADDTEPGIFYGFPMLPDAFGGPSGLKLAHHTPGPATTPDTVDRTIAPDDEQHILTFMDKYLPGVYGSTVALKTCLYTNTPDENFIIDFLPRVDTSGVDTSGVDTSGVDTSGVDTSEHDRNVVIAAGFSGHGFKFASAIGEILADLTLTGRTSSPIEFLAYQRLFELIDSSIRAPRY